MVIINTGTISNNNNSINISGNIVGSNITFTTANASIRDSNDFDEELPFDANSVERINIDSDVEVNMSVWNSSHTTVHFYGRADIAKEDIWFDARIIEHELKVQLKFIDDCFNSNLKLDIKVPYKTFKAIFADITSGDFSLDQGVSMESLRVSNTSGNVKLKLYATKDIEVGISTMCGSVSAEFHNVNFSYLATCSLSGTVRNYHKSGNGYLANVNISTTMGDITLY